MALFWTSSDFPHSSSEMPQTVCRTATEQSWKDYFRVCFLIYTALYKHKHNMYLENEEQHDIPDSCAACDLPQPAAFFTAVTCFSSVCVQLSIFA